MVVSNSTPLVSVRSNQSTAQLNFSQRCNRSLALILGSFSLLAAWIASTSGPLAWDEAVFALAGRNLESTSFISPLESLPNWSPLRAPGLPYVLGIIFKVLPAVDFVSRLPSIVGSVFFLWVIWKLVSRFADSEAALVAVTLISMTPGFLLTATLAFGDNIAGGIGLYTVLLAIRYVENDQAETRSYNHALVLIPLLLTLSTIIRYGVPFLVFLPLLGAACAQTYSGFRRRSFGKPLKLWSSLGVGALSLWIVVFKDPLSAGQSAAKARNESTSSPFLKGIRELLGTLSPGKVHYGFGGHFWGISFFALVIFPLLVAVAICLISFRRRIETLGLIVVAVTPMLAYSVVTRLFTVTYGGPLVAFAIAIAVVIVFRSGMRDLFASLRSSGTRSALSLVILLVIGLGSISAVKSDHEGLEGFRGIAQMSEVAGVISGKSCTIRTQRSPQVAWYSGCQTQPASPGSLGVDSSEGLGLWLDNEVIRLGPGGVTFFVLLENLRNQVEIAWFEDNLSENVEMISVGSSRRSVLITIRGV